MWPAAYSTNGSANPGCSAPNLSIKHQMNRLIARFRNDDVGFCLKVSVASAVTYLSGAFGALILDPKIAHHVRYGARHYPDWAYCEVPIFSLLIVVTTYLLMAGLARKSRLWLATLPTWLASIPTFWILRPELPHMNLLTNIGLASFLTMTAITIHDHKINTGYLNDPKMLQEAKLERAKQEISFWNTILLAFLGGYLALLVSWWNGVHEINKDITANQGEQFLLNNNGLFLMIVHSAWFLIGVVTEIAKKNRDSLKFLEGIQISEK